MSDDDATMGPDGWDGAAPPPVDPTLPPGFVPGAAPAPPPPPQAPAAQPFAPPPPVPPGGDGLLPPQQPPSRSNNTTLIAVVGAIGVVLILLLGVLIADPFGDDGDTTTTGETTTTAATAPTTTASPPTTAPTTTAPPPTTAPPTTAPPTTSPSTTAPLPPGADTPSITSARLKSAPDSTAEGELLGLQIGATQACLEFTYTGFQPGAPFRFDVRRNGEVLPQYGLSNNYDGPPDSGNTFCAFVDAGMDEAVWTIELYVYDRAVVRRHWQVSNSLEAFDVLFTNETEQEVCVIWAIPQAVTPPGRNQTGGSSVAPGGSTAGRLLGPATYRLAVLSCDLDIILDTTITIDQQSQVTIR